MILTFLSRREKDLSEELEAKNHKIRKLTLALESEKEAQRIVLDTKESILRSLITQSAQTSLEVLYFFISILKI